MSDTPRDQAKDGYLMAALRPFLDGTATPEQIREAILDAQEIKQKVLRRAFGCDMTKQAEA